MLNLHLIGKRHPLSPTDFEPKPSSQSTQQTTSETTEASTTQGSGSISVENGGEVINTLSPEDQSIVDSVLSFGTGIVTPILSTLDEAVTGANQLAENALNIASSAATTGENNTANIAATAEQNSQLGYSGILENPVFIIGIVAFIGIIVWASNRH